MDTEQYERLNALSIKAINDTATPNELEEFFVLLAIWNESAEHNLLRGLYVPNSISS